MKLLGIGRDPDQFEDRYRHCLERAKLLMEAEGWLPAPESAYSVCCAIDEALKCKESGEKKVIAFNISGRSFPDIFGYRAVLDLE